MIEYLTLSAQESPHVDSNTTGYSFADPPHDDGQRFGARYRLCPAHLQADWCALCASGALWLAQPSASDLATTGADGRYGRSPDLAPRAGSAFHPWSRAVFTAVAGAGGDR